MLSQWREGMSPCPQKELAGVGHRPRTRATRERTFGFTIYRFDLFILYRLAI